MASPMLVRRQLARRLRKLREQAGKSDRDVIASKLMSKAKLSRIETGRTAVSIADVWALCRLYGADSETTDALGQLAVGSAEHGWWEDYVAVVPQHLRLYIDMTSAAAGIRIYHPELIPGLLQIADYAKAINQITPNDADEATTRQRVELRMRRQQHVFGRVPPPQLTVVLSAVALLRRVGGAAAHQAQLDQLSKVAELHHVDLRVLPLDTEAHAAMGGGFTIFDFADDADPDVVYLESDVGAWYLEQEHELTLYRREFDDIYNRSIPFEEYTP